ncbi:MAG TPA: recombination protein RecR [Clostridiales bacterium]|nr:recombination protein RecR [Clostridiales bacterium]
MKNSIESMDRLINSFTKLPTVGQKTAERYAYAVISMDEEAVKEFANNLVQAKQNIKFCSVCGNWSEEEICPICKTRSNEIICVVKEPKDVVAMEKVRDFNGTYHVLHGAISPLQGKGPDDIHIKELLQRINSGDVKEVIMATNSDVEGEATSMYIARLLKPLGIKVTRLAQGISMGSDIEYADEVTLTKALQDRREI